MSEPLEVRAETIKLGRLLGREPDELSYLQDVSAADIRRLREQVTDALFNAHGQVLNRLAAASRLLPVSVVATIGQRAFGPVLSARIAGLLEPSRAVEMAERLPVAFLADVAVDIDPRRARDVIAQIPPRQIAAISRELVAREEYVTMGRFVGHLPPESVAAAVEAIDDRSLLRVAFVLESKDSLPELVALLPKSRFEGLIDAADAEGLWPEALDLLSNLSDEQRVEFAKLDAVQRQGALEAIVDAAAQNDLWREMLPLVTQLPQSGRERVVAAVRELELDEPVRAEVAAQLPELAQQR